MATTYRVGTDPTGQPQYFKSVDGGAEVATTQAEATGKPSTYGPAGGYDPALSGNQPTPRYGSDLSLGQSQQSNYLTSLMSPKSEQQIYQETQSQYQDQINSIKNYYATLVAQQQKANEAQMGRTRAGAAASGVLGQDFGNAALGTQEAAGQQAIGAIGAQQSAAEQQVYGNIRTEAKNEAQRQQDAAQKAMETNVANLQKQADLARADIAVYASQTPFAQLDQQSRDQLFTQSGFNTPQEFQAYYQAKEAESKSANTKVIGDATSGFYQQTVDPKTGDITIKRITDPAVKAQEPKEIGVDENGQKIYGTYNEATKQWEPIKISGAAATTAPTISPTGGINIYGIKATSTTTGLGGVDSGVTAKDGGTFLSSQGEAKDTEIAKKLLTSDIYSNLSVDSALKKWSNNGYGSDAVPTVDSKKMIKDLTPSELDQVLNGIKKREGVSTTSGTSQDYLYGDFVKTLSPQESVAFNNLKDVDKSNVVSLINGDIDIPTLMQSRGIAGSGARQKLLEKVKSVDPTYSDNRYKVKQQWDNPNGKAFLTRSAMNTAMSHMATTFESAKALGNTTIPKYNDLQNWFSKNVGNPELTSFVYDLTALSGEIASAYKNGTAPSELDTQRFFDAMSGSMSPDQFKGVFTQSSKLLAGKLKSLAQEYKQASGRYPTDPIVQPSVLDELKNIGVDTSSIDKLLEEQGYTPKTEGGSNNDPLGIR